MEKDILRNLLNTFDYPVQYDKVIGVGTNELLNGKDMDALYRTHEIIVLSGGIKIYGTVPKFV